MTTLGRSAFATKPFGLPPTFYIWSFKPGFVGGYDSLRAQVAAMLAGKEAVNTSLLAHVLGYEPISATLYLYMVAGLDSIAVATLDIELLSDIEVLPG
jgi:hypothetical protein